MGVVSYDRRYTNITVVDNIFVCIQYDTVVPTIMRLLLNEAVMTEPKTLSVPEAGKLYFGLSRNGSYDAARRGDLPTIRIGKLLRVPVAALERILEEADHGVSDAPRQGNQA